jgi:hypothetical protein
MRSACVPDVLRVPFIVTVAPSTGSESSKPITLPEMSRRYRRTLFYEGTQKQKQQRGEHKALHDYLF